MPASFSNLELSLGSYESALDKLEAIYPNISEIEIVALLVARDALQSALEDATEYKASIYLDIYQLDQKLYQYSQAIAQNIDLTAWRKSFNPPETSWWWYFTRPDDPRDRFNWLWNSLTIACLTANLSLLLDIASRFLIGGPNLLGSFTIIFQSLLALLAAGGTLSQTGRKTIETLLQYKGISKHRWHEAKLMLSLGLLAMLSIIHANLPQVAKLYSHWGQQHQNRGEWSSAKDSFERALKLNPDDAEAHFRLGLLYEDLSDPKQAQVQYQLAVQAEMPGAFNNLARLYILAGQYSEAIILLNRLDALLDTQYTDALEYGLRKNLGWAKLEQGHYNEAATHLQEAIRVNSERGAAYCLLAQVYEQQNDAGAFEPWEACLAKTRVNLPEKERWIQQARDFLKANLPDNE
ncbi:MAG: tetratricopeptide repeat protein [Cyanothece sp. SIO1E1]|nr:tetratricopeptide repeat protein [Cyanothece sp. SIO1E1]